MTAVVSPLALSTGLHFHTYLETKCHGICAQLNPAQGWGSIGFFLSLLVPLSMPRLAKVLFAPLCDKLEASWRPFLGTSPCRNLLMATRLLQCFSWPPTRTSRTPLAKFRCKEASRYDVRIRGGRGGMVMEKGHNIEVA